MIIKALNFKFIFNLSNIVFVAFLGFLFLLIVKNIDYQIFEKRIHPKIVIFWKEKEIKKIREKLKEIRNLDSVQYVKEYLPEEALKLLIPNFNEQKWLKDLLEESPLPITTIVVFKSSKSLSIKTFKKDLNTILKIKEIERVLNLKNMELFSLKRWQHLIRCLFAFLGLLGFLIAFIISNILRADLLSRKREVEILWLVGATRSYIIFPELLKAFSYVLSGLLISLGFTYLFYKFLNNLVNSPPIWFDLKFLNIKEIMIFSLFLVLISLLVTYLTSFFTIHHKIKGEAYEE